jgi:hypothetical protein
MKMGELHQFLEDELAFPVEQAAVVEHVGAEEVEAPDAEETETIADIIGPVGQTTYESADELFTTILGNVSDEYIGRKFYDDRGGNPPDTPAGPRDESDISF